MNKGKLNGKVAIVTGASKAFGSLSRKNSPMKARKWSSTTLRQRKMLIASWMKSPSAVDRPSRCRPMSPERRTLNGLSSSAAKESVRKYRRPGQQRGRLRLVADRRDYRGAIPSNVRCECSRSASGHSGGRQAVRFQWRQHY